MISLEVSWLNRFCFQEGKENDGQKASKKGRITTAQFGAVAEAAE